jgi:hypothetical protein
VLIDAASSCSSRALTATQSPPHPLWSFLCSLKLICLSRTRVVHFYVAAFAWVDMRSSNPAVCMHIPQNSTWSCDSAAVCLCEVVRARRFAAWVHGCRNGCLIVHPHAAFRLQCRAALHFNITVQAGGYVLAGSRWSTAMLLQCHVNSQGSSAAVQSSSAL